eukprot:653935-Rhodomonas_salina.1
MLPQFCLGHVAHHGLALRPGFNAEMSSWIPCFSCPELGKSQAEFRLNRVQSRLAALGSPYGIRHPGMMCTAVKLDEGVYNGQGAGATFADGGCLRYGRRFCGCTRGTAVRVHSLNTVYWAWVRAYATA